MCKHAKYLTTTKKPIEAFNGRAANYSEYRGSYPSSLLDFMVEQCGLTPDTTVADLGSGTGTLTKMLLDHKCCVYGIEPNGEMRSRAERSLADYDQFHSINATAESTTLPNASAGLVTVGRAIHWFDAPIALKEISRILQPGGWAVVIWNDRHEVASRTNLAYKKFIEKYCDDIALIKGRRSAAAELLRASRFRLEKLEFCREFNLEQLKGFVLSLSISPDPGSSRFKPMLRALDDMFTKNEVNGRVKLHYKTMVYYRCAPF